MVLEFDHVDPKGANVATLVTRGVKLERLAAEVEQCEVVCVNCPSPPYGGAGGLATWQR